MFITSVLLDVKFNFSTKLFKSRSQRVNYNGDGGAIFRLWEDPGEQNNLIRDQSLEWVKTEAFEWMKKEFKGARLPLHGANNEKHAKFYKSLMPPLMLFDPKRPNPTHPVYE